MAGPKGKQPRKPSKSFGEFASSFAKKLGSLVNKDKRTKTMIYTENPDIAQGPKKKR